MAKKHLEIERRWLLKELPDKEILYARGSVCIQYTAVYIYHDGKIETRIQQRVNHKGPHPQWHRDVRAEITYPLVTKIGTGLVRSESPKLLADETLYDFYYSQAELPRIAMRLWELPYLNGKKWEIKQPDPINNLSRLRFSFDKNVTLVEMEFDDIEEAKAFDSLPHPNWFSALMVKEVTHDHRYHVLRLAVNGRPDPE